MRPSSIKDDFIRYALASGRYRVTADGVIESLLHGRVRVLKPSVASDGYRRVGLSVHGECHYVKYHRVVAIAHIPNPENKPEINHEDGDKGHNHPSNLTWATTAENLEHGRKLGLIKMLKGDALPQAKLTLAQVDEIRELVKTSGLSQRKIGERYGISQSTVSSIITGTNWKDSHAA